DAHRVEVLDRADDDAAIVLVAHHLELELLPAGDRLLDQDLGVERALETGRADPLVLFDVVGDAAAGAAEREARTDHGWKSDAVARFDRLVHRVGDGAQRRLESDLGHRLTEEMAVLRLLDRVVVGADQLAVELLQDAALVELDRDVESRLSAERR